MTPPHTPESLLALTKSPEGLEQLLRIGLHYAEWTDVRFTGGFIQSRQLTACIPQDSQRLPAPKLTTSLDAIFAAEERLGLHDEANRKLRAFWYVNASKYFDPVWADASQRTAIFILTAQWKEQNP